MHEAGDPANPTIVLSHGFPELAHSWRHQMQPLADAGYHVIAPDQRGYGHSTAPTAIDAYGIDHLTGDLFGLLDHYGKDDAIFVGHDWGSMVVWESARLRPERVRAVVGVSVPCVDWPGPPTQLMRMVYGDRFFYILYFQQVGPPEAELGADARRTMSHGALRRVRRGDGRPRDAHRAAADGGHRLPHDDERATGAAVHGPRGRVAHRRRPRRVRRRVRAQRVLRPGQLVPQLRRATTSWWPASAPTASRCPATSSPATSTWCG